MRIKKLIKLLPLLFTVLALSGFDKAKLEKNNAEFLKIIKNVEIEVVAPASGNSTQTIQELKEISNLNLKFPVHCFKSPTDFHSESDTIRTKCLKEALFDNSANVVWATRGGYGSAKLLHELSKLAKPEKEKFFIGYSDITALHIFLTQEWGWKTIHGSVLAEIFDDRKSPENFIKIAQIVTGKTDHIVIKGLAAMNEAAVNSLEVKGTMTGGNLTMIVTTIGTPWQIKTNGKILFLEDVGIKPYQLDRTLYHLKHARLLNEIRAIIFGEFNEPAKENLRVLRDFASNLKVPVFKTDRFGHSKYNDPVVYNANGSIILQNNKTYDLKMNLK